MPRMLWMTLTMAACGSITPYTFDTDTPAVDSDTDPTNNPDTDGGGEDTDVTWTDSDAGSTDTDEEPGPVGSSDDPFIVEVVDGTASPNLRYIEIYNPSTSTIDMNGWKVNFVPDGVTANLETYTFPTHSLASGRTVVLCYDAGAAAFISTFPGKSCDFTTDKIYGDGNDSYALLSPSNSAKDLYGAFSGDGTGQPWEYTDSVAKRKASVGQGRAVSWQASEWTITSGQGAANPGSRN